MYVVAQTSEIVLFFLQTANVSKKNCITKKYKWDRVMAAAL